jgi:hypothetical protein
MPAEIPMGTEPKPKSASRKKRRRKPPEEFVDYIVRIESWDWSYSLSLNTERYAINPYHEFGCPDYRVGALMSLSRLPV